MSTSLKHSTKFNLNIGDGMGKVNEKWGLLIFWVRLKLAFKINTLKIKKPQKIKAFLANFMKRKLFINIVIIIG